MNWNQIKNWTYLTFWAAVTASVVIPCNSLNRTLENIADLAEVSKNYVQDNSDKEAGKKFRGIFLGYDQQRARGQQDMIRLLRRNIADVVGTDCPALENEEYDPLLFIQGPQGEVVMPVRCTEENHVFLYLVTSQERHYVNKE